MTDPPPHHSSSSSHAAVEVSLDGEAKEQQEEQNGDPVTPMPGGGRTTTNRRATMGNNRLESALMTNRAMQKYSSLRLLKLTTPKADATTTADAEATDGMTSSLATSDQDVKDFERHESMIEERTKADDRIKFFTNKEYKDTKYTFPVEVRMQHFSFKALVDANSTQIKTVYNSSLLYKIRTALKGDKPEPTTKVILDDVQLCLHPGKMYLILGSPGSGKSSLLKAIAGRLPKTSKTITIEGSVAYNGKTLAENTSQYHIENAVAYIDQLDRHAPRFTVKETFEFAYQCKTGGKPAGGGGGGGGKGADDHDAIDKPLAGISFVDLGLEWLGLTAVKDTFVGDETVRGVSGGQRRRVTVGEMMMDKTPLLCGDEISTGLDAASTYEMCDLMTYYGRLQRTCRVIALLQPSPETVSLFDDVIVLADGKILYSGPIEQVQSYFEDLGYQPPDQMDVADFLQVLSTPDAAALWEAKPLPEWLLSKSQSQQQRRTTAYTVPELVEVFQQSPQHDRIVKDLEAPLEYGWDKNDDCATAGAANPKTGQIPCYLSQWPGIQRKYANSFPRSTWLNLRRSLTLWVRDRRVLIANGIKNAVMGLSVGGVFWQTNDPISILGVLFQSMLFIMLGASTAAPALVDDRVIFRKHYEANFFSAYPFVVGRTISQMPQTLMDVLVFGSILYFMVGLDLAVENYFVFIAILFTFALLINQIMAVFAASASTKSTVQVICAVLLLFCILFGGFIVPPNVIPDWYVWIYWWNPFAWAYRALVVLEFQSPSWDDGNAILTSSGFLLPNGEPFQKVWVWYYFAYMAGHYLICIFLTAYNLGNVTGGSGGGTGVSSSDDETEGGAAGSSADGNKGDAAADDEKVVIPFVPATVTFEDICYDVPASTGNEKLRLLTSVNGMFESGRMVALMGSSGAGKTTLMDVIALRKSSGTVTGDVRINGFPQEPLSFKRASGFVEQFDVQSPELTVRETILYSARLRLDADKVKTDEEKCAFVDALIKTLELRPFADSLVGTSEDGGLSFEQKKRLSIAVELAASPSIIFLDEPTSGLDARSALLVVKLLRQIATEGRTICATIHQPSSAVFEMFDDLLLLKKGGRVVFFGELGEHSKHLIQYFEDRGARPIERGENPANWMLTEMTSDKTDFAEEYLKSEQYKTVKEKLAASKDNPDSDKKISYDTEFATSASTRNSLTNKRLMTIYWRSPNYNLSRITVSAVIALVMGSILIQDRFDKSFTETQMRAQFAVVFLSFIIMGIMSIFSVLPVMLSIRDMFHRHRSAGMLGSGSLGWALGYSEKGFILASTIIFCVVFLGISYGRNETPFKGKVIFWAFFTFNIAIYSYFGQAFVCFFRPMATAQILASVFIGLNNFFSGLIVRPQYMTGLFAITYWITPGHFVYEGMIVALFDEDNRTVVADAGGDFYNELDCPARNLTGDACKGTVQQYMTSFYGGKFTQEHRVMDFLVCGFCLVVARLLTFLALHYINFSAT